MGRSPEKDTIKLFLAIRRKIEEHYDESVKVIDKSSTDHEFWLVISEIVK